MSFTVKSGSSGNVADVSDDNKLQTKAISTPLQHYISHHKGLAYQVSGLLTVAVTDEPILFVKNDDPDHTMIISYIRLNSVGVAAASVDAYFTVSLSDTLTTAGDVVTPTNMNIASPNEADVVAYEHGGTLVVAAGDEIDRNYQANSMEGYNKEGTIVIPKGSAICIRFKGSTAAGLAYARISFYFDHL